MRIRLALVAASVMLVAGACGQDTTAPHVPVGPIVVSTLQCKQPDGTLVGCDLILASKGGFKVTLTSSVCAAVGDTVRVTKPLASVLTSDGCYETVGKTWTFAGPYDVGTAINLAFTSGSIRTNVGNSHSSVLVSGSAPTWTLSYEDGGEPWDNLDIIMTVETL